jgi:hypothetical protein
MWWLLNDCVKWCCAIKQLHFFWWTSVHTIYCKNLTFCWHQYGRHQWYQKPGKKDEIYEYREAVNKSASSWKSTTFEGKGISGENVHIKTGSEGKYYRWSEWSGCFL